MKSINLWALVAGAALFTPMLRAAGAESEDGFKQIFNGKDLSGWDGDANFWSVKDGAITGVTKTEPKLTHNTFLVYTNGELNDFELRLSYRIVNGNSGIQYRSKVLRRGQFGPIVGGYQADFEAGKTYSGILYEEQGRGILAQRGQKTVIEDDGDKHKVEVVGAVGKSEDIQAGIKNEDWNDYVVIAKGNHLQHFINGMPTVDVVDENAARAAKSGVLALQVHVGPPMTVSFKNIRLKTLSDGSQSAAEDLQKLQGVWEVTGGEVNGSAISESDIPPITLTITDKSYRVEREGNTDRGAFTLDPSKQPKQMDIQPGSGDGAGDKVLAIYEIGADSFRVCYAGPGDDRPKAFATEPDSRRLVINYQRKKQ
jgi:uncharacterized protein (TIGR03067 family)